MPSIAGRVRDRRIVIDVGLVLPNPGAADFGSAVVPFNVTTHLTRALVDTGAQSTCVTRSAVTRYGMPVIGQKLMGNAHSDEVHNTYAFRLAVQLADGRLWHLDQDIVGADIKPHPAFEILLGMDILGIGDLTINRDGRFTFAFP